MTCVSIVGGHSKLHNVWNMKGKCEASGRREKMPEEISCERGMMGILEVME